MGKKDTEHSKKEYLTFQGGGEVCPHPTTPKVPHWLSLRIPHWLSLRNTLTLDQYYLHKSFIKKDP